MIDLDIRRKIARLAALTSFDLIPDFNNPDVEHVKPNAQPIGDGIISDYRFARITGTDGKRLYGFYHVDFTDFLPLHDREENTAFDYLEAFTGENIDKKEKDRYNAYLLEGELVIRNSKRDSRNFLSCKDWVFVESNEESVEQLWISKLSFSRYQLAEYTFRKDEKRVRNYVLQDPEAKGSLYLLRGKSDVIHSLWRKKDGSLFLDNDNHLDYLKFFCWAIEADGGIFILPGKVHELPWQKAPDKELAGEVITLLKKAGRAEYIGSEQPDTGSVGARGIVAYGDALFEVGFNINDSSGMVTVVEDKPLKETLPFEIYTFEDTLSISWLLDRNRKIARLASFTSFDLIPDFRNPDVEMIEGLVIGDYRFARITGKDRKRLYGFYHRDFRDFLPLHDRNEDTAFDYLEAFTGETIDEKKKARYNAYLAEEEHDNKAEGERHIIKNAKRDSRNFLPCKDWVFGESNEESIEQLWVSKLSFSRYQLEEYTFRRDEGRIRNYVLRDSEAKESASDSFYSLRGKSDVIHSLRGKKDGSLFLDKDNHLDYLKFFCWAIDSDGGKFILPESVHELPWQKAPDKELAGEVRMLLNRANPTEYTDSEQPDKGKVRARGIVGYSNALFEARFTIDSSSGMVEMVDDKQLKEKLPFELYKFQETISSEWLLDRKRKVARLASFTSFDLIPDFNEPDVELIGDWIVGDYRFAGITGKDRKKLYGFYHRDFTDFLPLHDGQENTGFDYLEAFTGETIDKKEKARYNAYLAKEEHVIKNARRSNQIPFSLVERTFIKPSEQLHNTIQGFFQEQIEQLWISTLSFSSLQIAEYVFRPENGERVVNYALFSFDKLAKELTGFFILNPEEDIIEHLRQVKILQSYGDSPSPDMIRFYYWAKLVAGISEKHVFLPEKISELPWKEAPDKATAKRIKDLLNRDNENLNDQRGHSRIALYDHKLREVKFVLNRDEFNVKIEREEEGFVEDTVFEQYGSIKPVEIAVPPDTRQYLQSLGIGALPFIDSGVFIDQLKKQPGGVCREKKRSVKGRLVLSNRVLGHLGRREPGGILIRNYCFEDEVRLLSHKEESGDILVFENCVFSWQFSGKDSYQSQSVLFKNCVFLNRKKNETDNEGEQGVVIDLQNYQSEGSLEFIDCSIIGEVSAPNMKISGNLTFCGCTIANRNWERELSLTGLQHVGISNRYYSKLKWKVVQKEISNIKEKRAIVVDGVNFFPYSSFWMDRPILLIDNSIIKGHLQISFDPLDFRSEIRSDTVLLEEFRKKNCNRIIGKVSSRGVCVQGEATFFGSLIVGVLDLSNSVFSQNVLFNVYTSPIIQFRVLYGSVLMPNCKISGRLSMENVEVSTTAGEDDKLTSDYHWGISLRGISVNRDIELFKIKTNRDIDLSYASVKGGVRAPDKSKEVPERKAIMEVGRDLIFEYSEIKLVELEGVYVGRNIVARAATFDDFKIKAGRGENNDKGFYFNKADSFIFSGSKIKVLSLEGFSIKDKVEAVTGDFGSIVISTLKTEDYKVVYSQAKMVRLTGIKVGNSLDLSGIMITKDQKRKMPENLKVGAEDIYGITIQASSIGSDLSFSKDVSNENGEEGISLREDGPIADSNKRVVSARIYSGDLKINACRIGGRIEITNLKLGDELNGRYGSIDLSDSIVRLGISTNSFRAIPLAIDDAEYKSDLSDEPKVIKTSDLSKATRCADFRLSRIQADGDLDLARLHAEGDVKIDGSRVIGGIYLIADKETGEAFSNKNTDYKEDGTLSAKIGGEIDLTATQANWINFENRNFEEKLNKPEGISQEKNLENEVRPILETPRIKLERGIFHKLTILTPTPPIDLRGVKVDNWDLTNDKTLTREKNRSSRHEYLSAILSLSVGLLILLFASTGISEWLWQMIQDAPYTLFIMLVVMMFLALLVCVIQVIVQSQRDESGKNQRDSGRRNTSKKKKTAKQLRNEWIQVFQNNSWAHFVVIYSCFFGGYAVRNLQKAAQYELYLLLIVAGGFVVIGMLLGFLVNRKNTPEAESYKKVLKSMTPFEKGVYMEIESKLRNEAKEEDADEIYRSMRRKSMQEESWISKFGNRVFKGYFTGYGTEFIKMGILWFVLSFTYVSFVSLPGNHSSKKSDPDDRGVVPIHNDIGSADQGVISIWQAVEICLPHCIPLPLPATESCTVSERHNWLTNLVRILSYVLLSLTVLGITSRLIRGKK